MADEQTQTQEQTQEQTDPKPKSVELISKGVKEAVSAATGNGTESEVYKALVSSVAGKVKQERIDMLVKGFGKYEEAAKELAKIDRPDQEVFGRDGKPDKTKATYSKSRTEEIKKAEGKVSKISKAMDLAIEKGDYSKLKEIA